MHFVYYGLMNVKQIFKKKVIIVFILALHGSET